jgi:hypothetical protein
VDSAGDEKQLSDAAAVQPQDTKKKKRLNWPVTILLTLVVALLSYVGFTFYKNNYAGEPIAETSVTPVPLISNPNQSAISDIEKIVDDGVEWQPAKKLDDLQLFKRVTEGCEDILDGCEISVGYFSVGKLSSGEEIITAFVSYSISTTDIFRFTKKDDAYKLIQKNSDEVDGAVYYIDNGKVSYDSTRVFKSLLVDEVIDNGSTRLTYKFVGDSETDGNFMSEKVITDTKWGKLYLQQGSKITENNDSVKVARYYIKLNDGTKAYYEVSPTFLGDDGTLNIGWDNKTEFQKFATGCDGAYGSFPLIVDQTVIADKKVIDENTSGSEVYIPGSAENSLVDFGYGMYEQYHNGDKDNRDTYYSGNGIIIWIDDYGAAVAYSNKKYAPQVECDEPVAYLYSQKQS